MTLSHRTQNHKYCNELVIDIVSQNTQNTGKLLIWPFNPQPNLISSWCSGRHWSWRCSGWGWRSGLCTLCIPDGEDQDRLENQVQTVADEEELEQEQNK